MHLPDAALGGYDAGMGRVIRPRYRRRSDRKTRSWRKTKVRIGEKCSIPSCTSFSRIELHTRFMESLVYSAGSLASSALSYACSK